MITAEMSRPVTVGGNGSTSDRHRTILLTIAYLSAALGLVRSSSAATGSVYFSSWAETFAKHLGRLYGPSSSYLDWGLVPQAFLRRMGAGDIVKQVLGAPLTSNPEYPAPQYG